jgi:hypothetical protein
VVRRDLGHRSPPRPPISSRSPPASPVPAAAPEASARTKERLAALPLRTALAVGDRTSTSTLSPSGFEALRRKLRRQSTQPSSNAYGRRCGCYPVNVFGVTEVEYGYRARQFGFRSYMVRSCITHQYVGRYRGLLCLGYPDYPLYGRTTSLAICSILVAPNADTLRPRRTVYSMRHVLLPRLVAAELCA